jgi:hypothetical protein
LRIGESWMKQRVVDKANDGVGHLAYRRNRASLSSGINEAPV